MTASRAALLLHTILEELRRWVYKFVERMAKGQRLYGRNRRNDAGPAAEKKGSFENLECKNTRFLQRIADLLIWQCVDERFLVEILFLILARLILVGASTLALSLMVKCIIPSFCLAIKTFHFLRPRPLTNACGVFQMQQSSANVQKMLGYNA